MSDLEGVFVRIDIIDPHTYLELELNYKDLIEKIFTCGGYCLYTQIYKYYGSTSVGYNNIKRLEKMRLIGSETLNNNKYVYIKLTALKYLLYRNEEKIENKKLNDRILQSPCHVRMFNSINKFEYYLDEKKVIGINFSINTFMKYIELIRNALNTDERLTYLYLIKIENDDFVKKLSNTLKIMGERSSIYLVGIDENTKIENIILKFVVFDIGHIDENFAHKTLKNISAFLNKLGVKNLFNASKFDLEIVTTNEKKVATEKLVNIALKKIKNSNEYFNKSNSKYKNNPIISNILNVSVKGLDLNRYTIQSKRREED